MVALNGNRGTKNVGNYFQFQQIFSSSFLYFTVGFFRISSSEEAV